MRLFAAILMILAVENGIAQSYDAPELTCATTLSSGNVVLNWVEPTVGCGSFNSYKIYASNTGFGGPYTLLTTISTLGTTTWTHAGAGGTSTVWYYYMESDFSCGADTSDHSDTICNRDPTEPIINYVTVIPTGVQISWVPSVSPQTRGYIIYRDNSGFSAIDTVWGRWANSYIDMTASETTRSETYTIAAVDTCRNVGPLNNFPHNTIHLTSSIDGCAQEAVLNWNEYNDWTAGVKEYEVWRVVNSVPSLVATVTNTTFNYTHSTLFNDGDTIAYFIVANSNDGVTSSEFKRGDRHIGDHSAFNFCLPAFIGCCWQYRRN